MDTFETVIFSLGQVVAVAIGVSLLSASIYARRPSKGERGLVPMYIERTGGRFNSWNWTIPFVRVATFENFVSISCITHQIVLNRGDVTSIDTERHLISVGLRLQHHRVDLPDILIWPLNKDRLESALRASLGIKLVGNPDTT